MARRTAVTRMSVEQPLWWGLTGYRVLTCLYAVGLYGYAFHEYDMPLGAGGYLATLTLWTGCTVHRVRSAERCTVRFLACDMTVAMAGILLTGVFDDHQRVVAGEPTLPSIWTAGPVLASAIKGGWRWAAVASALIGAVSIVERGGFAQSTVHNVLLLWVAGVCIGYVVEVARASERTLARALRVDAATRERERLARDIHDSVLQVLAMVQRRGLAIGGEAAALGRMAGEQEVALRTLMTRGLDSSDGGDAADPPGATGQRRAEEGRAGQADGATVPTAAPPSTDAARDAERDLRPLLAPHAGALVSVAAPAAPVPLPARTATEVAAAVGAALDNVHRHAGPDAHAWILVEDETDTVLVTIRDDGPGIPAGRLDDAESQGRLGVAQSIRGRLRDVGGSATWLSVPGQGTEVELRIPRGVDDGSLGGEDGR